MVVFIECPRRRRCGSAVLHRFSPRLLTPGTFHRVGPLMLLKLAFAALGVIAVLYFVIIMQPATFRIARSITIAAPEDVIFSQLDDLHRWSRWNAFERDDASITVTHTGAPSGIGASYHFRG